jgi:hypothetical protein
VLGKQSLHYVSSFSPNQFNVNFSSVAAAVCPQVFFDKQMIFEGFAFREDEVFAIIMSISSGP